MEVNLREARQYLNEAAPSTHSLLKFLNLGDEKFYVYCAMKVKLLRDALTPLIVMAPNLSLQARKELERMAKT